MISKRLKNKISMFIRTSVTHKMPEFNINEVDEPICYVYLNNDEISLISHKDNVQGGEIIKVGYHDNEMVFYPAKKNSVFFANQNELRTFEFIECIVCTNLHVIAQKVHKQVLNLRSKILEYSEIYTKKMQKAHFSINIADNTQITHSHEALRKLCVEGIKSKCLEIMNANLLDSSLQLFETLHPNGIYDIESFISDEYNITPSILNRYINQSELADSALHSMNIDMEKHIFVVSYKINSLLLQHSVTKKIYASAEVFIENINAFNIQPSEIVYSNNDLSMMIYPEEIVLINQGDDDIVIERFSSAFECALSPDTIATNYANINIPRDYNVSIATDKNGNFMEDIDSAMLSTALLKHRIKVQYRLKNESKKFLGSSSHELNEVIANICAKEKERLDALDAAQKPVNPEELKGESAESQESVDSAES